MVLLSLAFVAACAVERAGLAGRDRADAGRLDGGRDAAAGHDGATDEDGGAGVDAGCAAAELCAAPGDEDCDGVVDEGCDWHFGRSSPVVGPHRSMDWHWSPVLSGDGRRLYYRAGVPGGPELYVVERASVTARFGEPTPVEGADFGDYGLSSFTLDGTEREMIVEAAPGGVGATRLYRATRASRSEPFGPLSRLDALASTDPAREYNPHLSRDGNELLFVSTRTGVDRIWRATRPAPGAAFSAPVEIGLPSHGGAEATPMLTPDGRTLFYARDWRIWRAERDSTDTEVFARAEQVPDLPDDANTYFPFVSQATREIFFVSERPWTPTATNGLWRARICRDGPCDEEVIDCPGGARSDDGRHCYVLGEDAVDWESAKAKCAEGGAELVSIHSPAERDLVRTLTSAELWTAGHDMTSECNLGIPGCVFEWTTGEPFLYAPWAVGEPNDFGGAEDCLRLQGNDFWDTRCENELDYVCERELWPW